MKEIMKWQPGRRNKINRPKQKDYRVSEKRTV